MRPRLYANKAAKQRAYRARMATLRARVMKLWFLPVSQVHRLAREIPWLSSLIKERDALKRRLEAENALAEIGRRWQAEKQRILDVKNSLADRVAALESKKHEREQRARRQRERRQEDSEAEARRRAALPFGDRLAPSTPIAPTIAPDQDTIGPNSGQSYPTIGPKTGQDRDTISPRIADEMPRPAEHETKRFIGRAPAEDDWRRYISPAPIAPPRADRCDISSHATPAPAPAPDKHTATLISKIKANGYQVNASNGTVLYDNRWIPAEEWMKRNGNVLD